MQKLSAMSLNRQLDYVFRSYYSHEKRRFLRKGWRERDVYALMEAVIKLGYGGNWTMIKNWAEFEDDWSPVAIADKWKNIRKQLTYVGIQDIWTKDH